ncbi:MAG: thiol protease/hemagglutinin PrtT [Candidatus Cloacimonetes bacterium]|nr:thiol protease/hemagglutinin PrtT [Candidatus Cloacimonadota bacterium]
MNKLIIALFIICWATIFASPVSYNSALEIAEKQLNRLDSTQEYSVLSSTKLLDEDRIIAYVFKLIPEGYIVTSADSELPPVIAYSLNSSLETQDGENNILQQLIKDDLALRLANINLVSPEIKRVRETIWNSSGSSNNAPPLEYWPPQGSTTTGGWIETRWTQSGVYSALCPWDRVTEARSLAGCPAVAIAQIMNYHHTINGTRFSDADDYYHSYGGNNYWIDNDHVYYAFPDFTELNGYLDNASIQMKYHNTLSSTDKGALVFAAGIAAQQVYGSGGSGTFGVSQAMQAFERFNFQNMELLTNTDQNVNSRMIENIMEGKPVHYAVVTPAWDSGHNFVVDGYNSDGFFHTNFGWGGTYDGWYLLPDELPYNLTVLEGAIVDIEPVRYGGIFPEEVEILSPEDIQNPVEFTVYNDSAIDGLVIENAFIDCSVDGIYWDTTHADFPLTLEFGETTTITVMPIRDYPTRTLVEADLLVIFPESSISAKIILDPTVSIDDEYAPVISDLSLINNYPNPFTYSTDIKFNLSESGFITISIYNIKGELVKKYSSFSTKGELSFNWDGKNMDNHPCASGIYFYAIRSKNSQVTSNMLLIK